MVIAWHEKALLVVLLQIVTLIKEGHDRLQEDRCDL